MSLYSVSSCVFMIKDNGDNDEDEISCTPSLAPSRFVQNNPACPAVLSVCNLENNFDSTRTSDKKEDVDNDPEEAMKIDEEGNCTSETCESSFTVDPEFTKSFLNSLYSAEIEEGSDVNTKVLCMKSIIIVLFVDELCEMPFGCDVCLVQNHLNPSFFIIFFVLFCVHLELVESVQM